jgi:hypothetical protein
LGYNRLEYAFGFVVSLTCTSCTLYNFYMQYLFEVLVIISGAPGGTGYYIIYEAEKSYWCKMKSWNQYRGMPVGDFALWKDGNQWKHTGKCTSLTKDVADQVIRFIDEWKYASDTYKDECRKKFKYMNEKP